MAFMGIFLMWAIAAVIVFCGFVGIVCLIISAVLKRRYNKKAALNADVKKPRSPIVLKITGWILLFPFIGSALFLGIFAAKIALECRNSLWYNIQAGNFQRVEELIDSGVSPDCTVDSNKPAQNGEKTILISICEH